ncbi:MAG: serine protease [Gemmatimonadales bacterium]
MAMAPTVSTLVLLAVPAVLSAQVTREDMIRRASEEFDAASRIELLSNAVDPAKGPADSVWAFGVQLLAQTLIEEGRDSLAAVWLRWAIRLAPDFQADPVQFLPEVVAAYHVASEFVRASTMPGDTVTATSWRWPITISGEPAGGIQAASPLPVTVQMGVRGVGTIGPDSIRPLWPGSYSIIAMAGGYEFAEVTREVLPGVVTQLEFNLAPLISERVVQGSASHLVKIRAHRERETACGTGFYAGSDGLVITSYSLLRGARALEVISAEGDRTVQDFSVAAFDANENLAILALPSPWIGPLPTAEEIADGQYAWAIHYPDCINRTASRTRLLTWEDRPEGRLLLIDALPQSAVGGPLIDRHGGMLGVAVSPNTALPFTVADLMLEGARVNIAEGRAVPAGELAGLGERPSLEAGKRGFPWGWVAAGVAAVGATVGVVLATSGDDGPSTGSITVTFPNP